MTHTHTKSPWHLGKRAGNPAIYAKDGTEIAEILQELTLEWRENARLIAAAPTMLAGLNAIKKQAEFSATTFPNAPGRGDFFAIARWAGESIAKAEGKA
jgi:hypothetical protein